MLQHKLKPYLKYCKNKYVVATLAFVLWMAFFDPKDIGQMYKRMQKLKSLKQSEKYFTNLIVDTKAEANLLKNNATSIETYAREHYYMKKDNEDLFIVKD